MFHRCFLESCDKCSQVNQTPSTHKTRRDVSIDAEQEVVVLSSDTTEQYRTAGFSNLQHRELVAEGGEASEGISGQRSELRNVADGSSSDDCGNGDGNGHQGL